MAQHLVFLFLTLFSFSSLTHVSSTHPKALVLPIHKDAATNFVIANTYGRTPLKPVGFVVDLTARYSWVNCETNYKSSTFAKPNCGSAQCKAAHTSYCNTCPFSATPFCHANTCGLLVENPMTFQSTIGEVAQDVIALYSTNGSNRGPLFRIPNFLFTCSPSALVEKGFPKGVQGVVGMGQGPIALQNQLTSRSGLKPIFTMCIPSTSSSHGVIFFGSNGPYNFLPKIDASRFFRYTPLIINPFGGYYINVESIRINHKRIPLNTTLRSVRGIGGTTINTLLPYTALEGSIFKAVTSFFRRLNAAAPVKPISPFGLCYESKHFPPTRLGLGVPSIDLVLEGKKAVWSIFGVNSMVEVKPGVVCLAFVNGGSKYTAAINIGTYQMQDVLLQFDLERSRLGFSGPLSGVRTHCHNFNFTILAIFVV